MIFHKALEKIEDACDTIQDAKMKSEFKVQFAEGILHHHIEQNDHIDDNIISWILRSANRQYIWSGTGARQAHACVKITVKEVKEERIIEPGLLTFRFYQNVITKFLLSEVEDKTQNSEDTSINITQFNRGVKQLIALELFTYYQGCEPTDYIPFYYDAGPRSFIKCSAEIHQIMKQPLAHLYYQVSLDRLTQLHGDKNLLTIFKIFHTFLDTNLSIDKDACYKVIARIEKQAMFQVILQAYSEHFISNPSNTVLQLIEQHPECIKEIHLHVDDHHFGGAQLGGHSWSMLYLISNKFTSMEAFESYLNILDYSKDELPWVHRCVSQLKKIERQTIPQFPFMNIRDKRFRSYRDCYEVLRNIAYATETAEQENIIEELSQLIKKVSHDRMGICNFRMYFWLGIYQEFYLKGIYCEELSRAIQSNKFAQLGLSEGKKKIILCFLHTDTMIRTSETVESLNPDAPIYELKENEVKMKQRTGEKKCFLFDFFSLNQKEHDVIVLRSILCNLIAIFIGLPDNTSHLSTLFLNPLSLMDTYIVSNLYPKPISKTLKYDCGCELNEDGSYGRPDYYSFDRKSFTLHSFYLMTLMNFGAFTVSLVTQPTALHNLSGHVFSEWKQTGLYCLSQLRTIWLHMQLQWDLTQEELGEFITNCFYDFYLLSLVPNSPLSPMVFKSTEEVEKYEFAIHTQVYDKNLKRTKEVHDVKAPHQPVLSEFSANVISFKKWYPIKITFFHLQHAIESCRSVDIKLEPTVNNFAILHRFISERKRFRISSILIPNLLKLYNLLHTNFNYFVTREEAEEKTIDEVIADINKKCKLPLNVLNVKELYERVLYFYRVYVKVCRGLIGFGPCAAIRREDKFMPLERNTKFIRLLSVTKEPEIGEDALYLVIQDLITTQNEFLQTVTETKKLLPWLSCYELETSTITPTEESTRNAFVSDLTPNEANHYWTSMKEIDENSLEIFELIRSRTTYTPFQNVDTCPYDLHALEQDIFWKYIASKPKFNTQTNLIHKVFKFKEIVLSNLPDPLNLQQFLTQMENYLSDKSARYLTVLPDPIVQNLEYHFHTLEYVDFCRLLNALRQTLQRLAQGSILMKGKEGELLQMSIEEFLEKQSPANDPDISALKNAGFTEFSDQQTNILAHDIKVDLLYSCMKFFLIKFNSRSYEYCKLPYCVKTPLPKDISSQIANIGKELAERLRSKDNAKKELEQLLTTLQHCEQTFIQSPQTFVRHTLLKFQLYDENDIVINLFPKTIQNAHYVALVGSLQSCIIDINRELAQRVEQRRTNTNEWKEQIVDFWHFLPHFWEVDDTVGDNADSSYDFSVVNSNPDLSFQFAQRTGGEMYQSGGKEEEAVPGMEEELIGDIDMGDSYDFTFI